MMTWQDDTVYDGGRDETTGDGEDNEGHGKGIDFPGGRGGVGRGATLYPNIYNVFFLVT